MLLPADDCTHGVAPDVPFGVWDKTARLPDGMDSMTQRLDILWTIALASLQGQVQACAGSLGEIGVHRGAYFSVLARLAAAQESLWACDLFADQHLNLDGSGKRKGNFSAFLNNVQLVAGRSDVKVYVGPSYDLGRRDGYHHANGLQASALFRFFSIDGSHMTVNAFTDLVWASQRLAPGGVIALDDVMHPHWAGPARAIRAFWHLHDREYNLRPLLLAQKKLFLVQREWHNKYSVALRRLISLAKNSSAEEGLSWMKALHPVSGGRFAHVLAVFDPSWSDSSTHAVTTDAAAMAARRAETPLWLPMQPEKDHFSIFASAAALNAAAAASQHGGHYNGTIRSRESPAPD
jgi:hypothetical protein